MMTNDEAYAHALRNFDPIGVARQARHGTVGHYPHPHDLGQTQRGTQQRANLDAEPFDVFNKVVAQYVVSIELSGDDGADQGGNTQLRPEPFVLQSITWATTGDVYPAVPIDAMGSAASVAGRAVEMTWGDSFTKFMGLKSGLIPAVLGDSNGFLDLPAPVLFQGSQPLDITLRRLFWPADEEENPRITTRWDFTFTGIGLLPKGVNASGSAG